MPVLRRTWLASLCALTLWTACAAVAHAGETDAQPQSDWVTTRDGGYVVDLSARVVWSRCLEGMRWNGRGCEGSPLLLTHAGAVARARSRAQSDGLAWRLPNARELRALALRNAHPSPGEPSLFPVGQDEWCWSSTTRVDTSQVNNYNYGNVMKGVNGENLARLHFLHASSVDMVSAEMRSDTPKRTLLYVRLVMPID